jgi:hypothetical protein
MPRTWRLKHPGCAYRRPRRGMRGHRPAKKLLNAAFTPGACIFPPRALLRLTARSPPPTINSYICSKPREDLRLLEKQSPPRSQDGLVKIDDLCALGERGWEPVLGAGRRWRAESNGESAGDIDIYCRRIIINCPTASDIYTWKANTHSRPRPRPLSLSHYVSLAHRLYVFLN